MVKKTRPTCVMTRICTIFVAINSLHPVIFSNMTVPEQRSKMPPRQTPLMSPCSILGRAGSLVGRRITAYSEPDVGEDWAAGY